MNLPSDEFELFIGIDVGFNGAIGVLDSAGEIHSLNRMPIKTKKIGGKNRRRVDEAEFISIIGEIKATNKAVVACVEQAHARPMEGVSSSFAFGECFGFIKGVLLSHRIRTTIVSPMKWKLAILGEGKHDKEDSLRMAREEWGADRFKLKKDDGLAESLLIARWLKEFKLGPTPIDRGHPEGVQLAEWLRAKRLGGTLPNSC